MQTWGVMSEDGSLASADAMTEDDADESSHSLGHYDTWGARGTTDAGTHTTTTTLYSKQLFTKDVKVSGAGSPTPMVGKSYMRRGLNSQSPLQVSTEVTGRSNSSRQSQSQSPSQTEGASFMEAVSELQKDLTPNTALTWMDEAESRIQKRLERAAPAPTPQQEKFDAWLTTHQYLMTGLGCPDPDRAGVVSSPKRNSALKHTERGQRRDSEVQTPDLSIDTTSRHSSRGRSPKARFRIDRDTLIPGHDDETTVDEDLLRTQAMLHPTPGGLSPSVSPRRVLVDHFDTMTASPPPKSPQRHGLSSRSASRRHSVHADDDEDLRDVSPSVLRALPAPVPPPPNSPERAEVVLSVSLARGNGNSRRASLSQASSSPSHHQRLRSKSVDTQASSMSEAGRGAYAGHLGPDLDVTNNYFNNYNNYKEYKYNRGRSQSLGGQSLGGQSSASVRRASVSRDREASLQMYLHSFGGPYMKVAENGSYSVMADDKPSNQRRLSSYSLNAMPPLEEAQERARRRVRSAHMYSAMRGNPGQNGGQSGGGGGYVPSGRKGMKYTQQPTQTRRSVHQKENYVRSASYTPAVTTYNSRSKTPKSQSRSRSRSQPGETNQDKTALISALNSSKGTIQDEVYTGSIEVDVEMLQTLVAPWSQRLQSLVNVHNLLKTGWVPNNNDFAEAIIRGLAVQLPDHRAAVVKHTTTVLTHLCNSLGSKRFSPFVHVVLPNLLQLLGNSLAVFHTAARACLLTIIRICAPIEHIGVFLKASTGKVRDSITEMLAELLGFAVKLVNVSVTLMTFLKGGQEMKVSSVLPYGQPHSRVRKAFAKTLGAKAGSIKMYFRGRVVDDHSLLRCADSEYEHQRISPHGGVLLAFVGAQLRDEHAAMSAATAKCFWLSYLLFPALSEALYTKLPVPVRATLHRHKPPTPSFVLPDSLSIKAKRSKSEYIFNNAGANTRLSITPVDTVSASRQRKRV